MNRNLFKRIFFAVAFAGASVAGAQAAVTRDVYTNGASISDTRSAYTDGANDAKFDVYSGGAWSGDTRYPATGSYTDAARSVDPYYDGALA